MIHPAAVIEAGAKIGPDVRIGPGVFVSKDAELGSGCIIGPNAVIHAYTRIGEHCRIHSGAVVGDTPQDLAFQEAISYVRIGNRCTLREGVTVHRGTKDGTETVVGDDCFLMSNSHLAHNVRLGNRVITASGALLGGYVEVGDGAFISGNAVVHQFCRIGRMAMIGGLSAISKDIPPFCTTRSGQYNVVVGLNTVGLRRNGFTPDQRKAVRQCLDVVYKSGLNISQAVEQLNALTDQVFAREWVEFIKSSRRGLCRFTTGREDED